MNIRITKSYSKNTSTLLFLFFLSNNLKTIPYVTFKNEEATNVLSI